MANTFSTPDNQRASAHPTGEGTGASPHPYILAYLYCLSRENCRRCPASPCRPHKNSNSGENSGLSPERRRCAVEHAHGRYGVGRGDQGGEDFFAAGRVLRYTMPIEWAGLEMLTTIRTSVASTKVSRSGWPSSSRARLDSGAIITG